jgi:hypothetical protein
MWHPMSPFGQDNSIPAAGSHKSDGRIAPSPVTHRLTVDLARAETLAQMLASSRASTAVEVSDLLAGMYIYEWDRLSKYWSDTEPIEEFLRQMCRISPQRWHHWIEFYDENRKRSEPKHAWILGRKSGETSPSKKKPLPCSSEVLAVLKRAEVITPFHDKLDGGFVPILTSESVLLSIALNLESSVGQKLAETGLDLAGLQQDARDKRRAPQAWRDEK